MKLLVVGASATPVCGVRDCARVLASAFEHAGVENETLWWERQPHAGVGATRAAAAAFAGELGVRAQSFRPDAVLWHYSPFAYGPRGLPAGVGSFRRAVARTGVPAAGLLHEYAYPWGRRGWRGTVQASSQRLALAGVVRSLAGLVATTDERGEWLRTRAWLPSRPVTVLPVPSNIDASVTDSSRNGGPPRIGLFGYSGDAAEPALVIAAVAGIRRRQPDARLVLLGAPGPDSAAAEIWRNAALAEGIGSAIEFTGTLAAGELSRALAALDVVVVADDVGPTARRGTLAAALAHGKAVVAVDGPATWRALAAEGAVALTARDPGALAETLASVIGDDARRAELERRALAFYRREAAPDVVARKLLAFIEELT